MQVKKGFAYVEIIITHAHIHIYEQTPHRHGCIWFSMQKFRIRQKNVEMCAFIAWTWAVSFRYALTKSRENNNNTKLMFWIFCCLLAYNKMWHWTYVEKTTIIIECIFCSLFFTMTNDIHKVQDGNSLKWMTCSRSLIKITGLLLKSS